MKIGLDALAFCLLILLVLFVFGPAAMPLLEHDSVSLELKQYDGKTPQKIDWNLLSELYLGDLSVTPGIRAIDGEIVALAGYLIPLDDELERASEFLLVPYFGACIHLPPPPENQMVHVVMRGQRKVVMRSYGWDPTWLIGRFHVRRSRSALGGAAYEMEGLESLPFSAKSGAGS